ncbi:MAG: DUF4097 family beta strand repeat protein [Eubacterium sp.]|nr:DUF4097 family beta strand repeat protein [Eubacterium sp.]
MDTLREYLENMFRNVENTPEIEKAKAELYQMMEDKYEQLMADGKSENEAVGTVIMEFGNFDEIVKELGIEDSVRQAGADGSSDPDENVNGGNESNAGGAGASAGNTTAGGNGSSAGGNAGAAGGSTWSGAGTYKRKPNVKKEHWSKENANEYVTYAKKHAMYMGLGVALCILPPFMATVMTTGLSFLTYVASGILGGFSFFLCIGIAVALFISAAHQTSLHGKVKRRAIELDQSAREFIDQSAYALDGKRHVCLVIGVLLIIMGPFVSGFAGIMPGVALKAIVGSSVLACTAIGVGLIVYQKSLGNRFKELSFACYNADMVGNSDGGIYTGNSTYANSAYGAGSSTHSNTSSAGTNGNNWQYRPKSNKSIITIILFIASVFVILMITLGVMSSMNIIPNVFRFVGGHMEVYEGSTTFSADDIDRISFDVSTADIVIEEGKVSEVGFRHEGSFPSMPTARMNGSKLDIKCNSPWFLNFFNVFNQTGTITVTIPEGRVYSYFVESSAGKLDVTGIKAQNFETDMSAGSANINDVYCEGTLELDSSAGSIKMNGSGGKKLVIDASAGSVDVQSGDFERIEADLSAGSFKYDMADKTRASEYDVELDSSAGSIHYMGQDVGDEFQARGNGDGSRSIEVDTSAGSITIK